jgi:hypothetical protein
VMRAKPFDWVVIAVLLDSGRQLREWFECRQCRHALE